MQRYNLQSIRWSCTHGSTFPIHVPILAHVSLPQTDLLDWCRKHDVVLQAYSSFGQGRLFEEEHRIDVRVLDSDVTATSLLSQVDLESMLLNQNGHSGPPPSYSMILLRWAIEQNIRTRVIDQNHVFSFSSS